MMKALYSALFLFLLVGIPDEASASMRLRFCNSTGSSVWIAGAEQQPPEVPKPGEEKNWRLTGWIKLDNGECSSTFFLVSTGWDFWVSVSVMRGGVLVAKDYNRRDFIKRKNPLKKMCLSPSTRRFNWLMTTSELQKCRKGEQLVATSFGVVGGGSFFKTQDATITLE